MLQTEERVKDVEVIDGKPTTGSVCYGWEEGETPVPGFVPFD